MIRRQRLQPVTSINLIPLIDVLLLIIIFFMVTTTFKLVPGISLQLPSSSTAHNVQRVEQGGP
jgi:biopolymer transport protein ExbD